MKKTLKGKRELIRLLLRHGYQRAQVVALLRFIDWVLVLPQALEDDLDDEIAEALEEKKMPYITSWERRGEARGEARGIVIGEQRGKLNLILPQLKRCFGALDAALQMRVVALTARQLDKLAVALFDFTQPADLERWLKRQRKPRAQATEN